MLVSERLKVVQLVPRMNEGGVERGVADIVREHGYEVQHYVLSEGGKLEAEIIKHGGRTMRMAMAGKNPLNALWRAARLRDTLRHIAPDIVHVRSRVPAWLHYFANRKLRIRTVSTAHGINSINPYSKIMTAAAAVICPSAAVAEHLLRAYGTQHTVIIPRGVDMDYFSPAAVDAAAVEHLREQWGLHGKHILLHVGRLAEQKGHDILLRALVELPEKYTALIAGGGSARRMRRLAELARGLGVAERVIMAGSRTDMREIYALADTTLSCAIKPESFGRTMAESLAMNTPVIAAMHGGALDILSKEESGGRGVIPGDVQSLVSAILGPPLDASNSRTRIAEKFTASRMAAETLKVYRRVLEK